MIGPFWQNVAFFGTEISTGTATVSLEDKWRLPPSIVLSLDQHACSPNLTVLRTHTLQAVVILVGDNTIMGNIAQLAAGGEVSRTHNYTPEHYFDPNKQKHVIYCQTAAALGQPRQYLTTCATRPVSTDAPHSDLN